MDENPYKPPLIWSDAPPKRYNVRLKTLFGAGFYVCLLTLILSANSLGGLHPLTLIANAAVIALAVAIIYHSARSKTPTPVNLAAKQRSKG